MGAILPQPRENHPQPYRDCDSVTWINAEGLANVSVIEQISLLDIYVSSVSNRMNEVMKVLTVFASIFIPMTFLTGIYGMNFEYMPELKWHWAYPALWCVFLTISTVLLLYFRRKKWI